MAASERCRSCDHERGWHIRGEHECHKGACECTVFVADLPAARVLPTSNRITFSADSNAGAVVSMTATTTAAAPEPGQVFTLPPGRQRLSTTILRNTLDSYRPTCQRCGTEVEIVAVDRSVFEDTTILHVRCHDEFDQIELRSEDIIGATSLGDFLRGLWAFTGSRREATSR